MSGDRDLHHLDERFDRHRVKMMSTHEGEWALLIRGERSPYFFDTENKAINDGYGLAAGRRFLVKQVLETDRVFTLSRVAFAD